MRTRSQNICVSAEPGFSLRAATSLMPTDAIGGLQIGFTTVEAGDFPNGLRCNRQILYIRVCHSAHHQISSFPAHRETGLIKLLFPRIHVLHMNEKAVYFLSGWGKVFQSISSLPFQPPPPRRLLRLQSTPNKCGHSGRLVVYFVSNLSPSWQLTWHIINSYKDESAIRTLCLWIGCEVAPGRRSLLSPHLAWIIHGESEKGHHFEMWPGQQITFCFGSAVKVNVSQVRTRVMHSWLSHFADWMTRQIVSSRSHKKKGKSKGRIESDVTREYMHPAVVY